MIILSKWILIDLPRKVCSIMRRKTNYSFSLEDASNLFVALAVFLEAMNYIYI